MLRAVRHPPRAATRGLAVTVPRAVARLVVLHQNKKEKQK